MKYRNNKLILSLFVIIAAFSSMIYVNSFVSKGVNSRTFKENAKKIILIDPGHGGLDGGAVSKNGTVEKDITLKISLKLRDKLKKKGYSIIMTREEDKGLYGEDGTIRKKKIEDLNNRCKMKKESNCNLFISIHLNMFPQSQYYGAQVWFSKNGESKKLAKLIQDNLKKDLDNNNRRVEKPAMNSYKILRCYDIVPSVIVESGFLSNPMEESKLKDDKYQDKIAESLTKSIDMYFNVKE